MPRKHHVDELARHRKYQLAIASVLTPAIDDRRRHDLPAQSRVAVRAEVRFLNDGLEILADTAKLLDSEARNVRASITSLSKVRFPSLIDWSICWRARFTFEHYEDKGFTGGVFFTVTETSRGYGDLLTIDYTPALIDEVARRFVVWARNHPQPVAIVIKKKGWKGAAVHQWGWEELVCSS